MSKRRQREILSSNSSQESSPQHKSIKMAEGDTDQETIEDEEIPTLSMIYKILLGVQGNTKKIIEDNKEMRQEIDDVKKALDFQFKTVDELTQANTKVNSVVKEQESLIK